MIQFQNSAVIWCMLVAFLLAHNSIRLIRYGRSNTKESIGGEDVYVGIFGIVASIVLVMASARMLM